MTTQEAYDRLYQALTPLLGDGEARSVARIVLEDGFQWRRGQRPRDLDQGESARLGAIETQLLEGVPVQYILGVTVFYGLQLLVTPAVLIPRPETEELVEWIVEDWRSRVRQGQEARLLDIGTGSGCIPLAVKHELPEAQIYGWDISTKALEVARMNARRLGLPGIWQARDILDRTAWPKGHRWEVIVSNPPYIPPSERSLMPVQVLKHEPHEALFVPEEDALLFYRIILDFAWHHLAESGRVYFECNEHTAEQVAELAQKKGFAGELRRDLQGKWRMWAGGLEA